MILLLSDVHCLYEVVNQQIAHAEATTGRPVDAAIILGDVGLFEPQLGRFFRRAGERFTRPTYFIEGNHEDHDHLAALASAYGHILEHLPRSSVRVIDGHRFLCLGGAGYMDAHTTPWSAVITATDIEACLAHPHGAIDAILSHDCPQGIGVPNRPGFEHYGPPGFEGSSSLLAHFAPRFWFFGHHHRWHDYTIGGTRFAGLAQSWKGYGLLDHDGTLRVVQHSVPIATPFWAGLRRRWLSVWRR
jgi:predicted phosphodiesterase